MLFLLRGESKGSKINSPAGEGRAKYARQAFPPFLNSINDFYMSFHVFIYSWARGDRECIQSGKYRNARAHPLEISPPVIGNGKSQRPIEFSGESDHHTSQKDPLIARINEI
jgi:hypothetical protein